MIEQQLVDYIKKAKTAGQQDAQTRTLLAKNGWTEAEINDAFAAVNPPQTASRPPVENNPQPVSQFQPKTETQVSGQPRVDVRPQTETQPQYKPQAQPAFRPQAQTQAQPQAQPRYSPAQPQSNMPKIKTKSHLLAKVLVTLVVVIVLAGGGVYSSDKFFNTNILSYIKSILPWNPLTSFEADPQTVINSMIEKMNAVTSSRVTAQIQASVKTGNLTQGSVAMNVVGGSDLKDANNPKSDANISFAFSQFGSATPTASANVNLITIGDVGYIKVNSIVLPPDNPLIPSFDISQLQNKFMKIDQESADILAESDINSGQVPQIDTQARLDLGKKIRDLFLAGNIISFKEKLSDEKISGQNTHHYLLTIKKEKIQEFLTQIITMQAEQFPEMSLQLDDVQTTLEPMASMIGDVDIEAWIGKSDNYLYRIKTDKTINIGELIPILNLQANIALDATYSDHNKPLNIQEPQGTQKIEDVILPIITAQKIATDLNRIGFEAENLFSAKQNYYLMCKNGFLNGSRTTSYGITFVSVANNLIKLGAKNPICFATAQDYCVSTQLKDGGFMCIDKYGIVGSVKCESSKTPCFEKDFPQ